MAREMKDSGIEWIGEIPKEHRIYRLKYLLRKPLDYGANSSGVEYLDYLPRYIRITDIAADGKLKNDGALSIELEDTSPYLLEDGDILFARSGATVGKSFIYYAEYGRAAFAGYLIRAQLNEKIVPEYVYYYTCSTGYEIWKNGIFIQSTIQNISADKYANLPIVLPDTKDEQMRIARILKYVSIELDNVFEKTRASIEEYKKLKQAVITQAVTKGVRGNREMKDSGIEWIGEIPTEWEVSQVKYLLKWKSEKGQPQEDVLSLYRDYGIIPKDSRDDNHNVTSLDTSGYKVVDIGDFVINKMKAWQGSMAVSEYRGIISPAYHVCEFTNDKINRKYFHYLMRNKSYIPEYTRLSTGMRVGQWDLGFDDFKNIPFLLPSQEEQQEIVNYLAQKCSAIDELIIKKEQYLSEIENYKKSFIYEYVTGKKEVPQE